MLRTLIVVAGDLLPGRRIPVGSLGSLTSGLPAGALVCANLEGVLTDRPREGGLFAAPTSRAAELAAAGIGVVSVANNHSRDHGVEGLADTLAALAAAGITAIGVETDDPLVVSEHGGLRIGWLASARTGQHQEGEPRFRELDRERLLDEVRAARGRVDVLVCVLHLGYMYVDYPHPEHRALTHALVDAGADLVVCHHAHVLQGIERRGRGLIAHNLGNLLVDPDEGVIASPVEPELQREGGVLVVEVGPEGVGEHSFVPTIIDADLRLAVPSPERRQRILDRLERISTALEGDYLPEFERQRAERNADLGLAEIGLLVRRGRVGELVRMLRRARMEHVRMVWRRVVG